MIVANMERIRNWLLPVLLAIQQLAVWPGRPLLDGDAVGAARLAGGLAAAVVVTAALGVRRSLPVAAALTLEVVLAAGLILPENATLLHSLSVMVALYSVAVRCPVSISTCPYHSPVGVSSARCRSRACLLVRHIRAQSASSNSRAHLSKYS